MKSNNIQLSIKDIVLLKQDPYNYYITKTHDGTSMGPLRQKIKDFYRRYGTDDEVIINVYDDDHSTARAEHYGNVFDSDYYDPDEAYLIEEVKDLEITDGHIIRNIGHEYVDFTHPYSYESLDKYEDMYSAPNTHDLEQLTAKNDEGEYMFRSMTLVSPNGASISFIKDNQFSSEDEKGFMELVEKYNLDCYDYSNKYSADVDDNRNGIVEERNAIEGGVEWRLDPKEHFKVNDDSIKRTTEQNGTLYDFIKDNGYEDDFEKYHVKVRIRGKELNKE